MIHYMRMRKGIRMDRPRRPKRRNGEKPKDCKQSDCESPSWARGFCKFHYERFKNGADMDMPKRSHHKGIRPIGSRSYDHDGYVVVKVAKGTRNRNWRKEHRLVMERHLGRELRPEENVHHKNGIRDDNRLDNLELWVKTQPVGQRVTDLVDWARNVLLRYESEADNLAI